MLILILTTGCASQSNNNQSTTATQTTSQSQSQTKNIDISDENIITIIEAQTIEVEGSYFNTNHGNEEKISANKIKFPAQFDNVKLIDKNFSAADENTLIVHYEAFIKTLTLISDKSYPFTIHLNKSDDFSVMLEPKQQTEIIINPVVEFNKDYLYDQKLTVHFQVAAKDYNANPEFYTPPGADVARLDDVVNGAYKITFEVNKDTVKNIEVLPGNLELDFFVGNFLEKWVNYRLNLSSGAIIQSKQELKYIYRVETEENKNTESRKVNANSAPYEYWNFGDKFEQNRWGVYTE